MTWSVTFRPCTSCASSPLDADNVRLLTLSVHPLLIRLSSVRTVYVTVGDISRTGAYVVRRGELEVMADEDVPLEVSDYESNQNVSLQSRVKWVRTKSYNTLVGLVFTEGPLLPGTMLDQYLDRTLMGRGSGPV